MASIVFLICGGAFLVRAFVASSDEMYVLNFIAAGVFILCSIGSYIGDTINRKDKGK